jgi:hypothetical protein
MTTYSEHPLRLAIGTVSSKPRASARRSPRVIILAEGSDGQSDAVARMVAVGLGAVAPPAWHASVVDAAPSSCSPAKMCGGR